VHEGSSGARLFPTYARTMVGYGAGFKKTVRSYYTSPIGFNTRGEMLARWENYVDIDKNVVDAWGIPVLKIHCRWSDNEIEMARDARENLVALFHALGAEQVRVSRDLAGPGVPPFTTWHRSYGQRSKRAFSTNTIRRMTPKTSSWWMARL
jgi:hypothetical protein